MLSTKNRVKKESFIKIMKDGVFLHSPNFCLRFIDQKNNLSPLFGVIVAKKVKKTAVGRHLIKRKVNFIVEVFLKNVKSSISCLIFVKKDISSSLSIEIKKEIMDLFKKGYLLN
jgi:ribonuclease P protein component